MEEKENKIKLNQLERLEILSKRIKLEEIDISKMNYFQLEMLNKLKILRKNPEYIDKLVSFRMKDIYSTSSNDLIFFIKIDQISTN